MQIEREFNLPGIVLRFFERWNFFRRKHPKKTANNEKAKSESRFVSRP